MDRRLSSFVNTFVSVCLGFLIWFLILAISQSNSKPIDITKGGRFTLAPQSAQAVQELAQPVKAVVFVSERERTKSEELLNRYKKVSNGKFSFEVLDLRKNPLAARNYGVKMAGEGVVEVVSPDAKPSATPGPDGKEVKAGSGRTERLSSISEQDLTAALLKLQRNKTYKAYFLTGHGERDINTGDSRGFSQLKADLSKEGFIIEPLTLAASPKIPADANIVVSAGPIQPLNPGEEKILRDYLANYGRYLLMTEPETPDSYGKLVKDYGVTVTDNIVLDQASEMLRAEPVYSLGLVYDPGHPITKDYKMQTMFQLARPIEAVSPAPSGVVTTTLVKTSNSPLTALIIKTSDVIGQKALRLDLTKVKPTMASLAVAAIKAEKSAAATPTPSATPAAEQAKDTKETRVVVVGDSDSMSNELYVINKDFALNSFNWLAANDTQISIRPKEPGSTPLSMTGSQQSKMMFMLAFFLPGALVAAGILNAMRRQ